MIDFEKLAKDVAVLEKDAAKAAKGDVEAIKSFLTLSRDILMEFLKDRKEPIRPGHIFQNAAAKQIIPTEIAVRGDHLLTVWGGKVTPTDAKAIQDHAAKVKAIADKLIPVLKAYRKEDAPTPKKS